MFKKLPRTNCNYIIIDFSSGELKSFHKVDNQKFTIFGLCISIEKDFVKIYQNGVYHMYDKSMIQHIEVGF